ncbi:MAG: F0F1 ATP synthase subunit delta [Candidatus Moraniibacteriota bacterium]
MRLSIPQYAQALLELEREGGATETASRFFAWLNRRGEGRKAGKIVEVAERLLREQSDIMDVTVTTAQEADTATQELLLAQAETVFVGQKIEARFSTDADVIGGAKFRSESFLYDATLSTAVRKLRTSLSR